MATICAKRIVIKGKAKLSNSQSFKEIIAIPKKRERQILPTLTIFFIFNILRKGVSSMMFLITAAVNNAPK